MLKLNSYICALDIGSSKIAAALALLKGRRIVNIFFDSVPSRGVKNGSIVDSIELVGSISRLMSSLKAKSGIKIKFLHANISGQDLTTKHSRAIVPLAERGNKVITALDINKVCEEARILGSSLEEEIIHQIPASYAIDSKGNVANPIGLYSHRLEVDLYLICAKLSGVQSLGRVISQSGYEIKDLSFSGLATSGIVFNEGLKEGFNFFCDIGSDTTEMLLFKNGILKDIEVLGFGGDNITAKLRDELKIPFELAEDIKRSYGVIGEPQHIAEDKEILVKKNELYKPIKQKMVCEIITQAAKAISLNIKEAVEKRASSYEVDNFVVAGRSILLEGFIEALENTLSIPVKLGRISNSEISAFIRGSRELSGSKYLAYLTALGMIHDQMQAKLKRNYLTPQLPRNLIFKAADRLKEVYQEYF